MQPFKIGDSVKNTWRSLSINFLTHIKLGVYTVGNDVYLNSGYNILHELSVLVRYRNQLAGFCPKVLFPVFKLYNIKQVKRLKVKRHFVVYIMFINHVFNCLLNQYDGNFGLGNVGHNIESLSVNKVVFLPLKFLFYCVFFCQREVSYNDQGVRAKLSKKDIFEGPGRFGPGKNSYFPTVFLKLGNKPSFGLVFKHGKKGYVVAFGKVFNDVVPAGLPTRSLSIGQKRNQH